MILHWAVNPVLPGEMTVPPGVELHQYAQVDIGSFLPRWTAAGLTDWTPADFSEFVGACFHETPGTFPVVGPDYTGTLVVDTEYIHPDGVWGEQFYRLLIWCLRRSFPKAQLGVYGFPVQRHEPWDDVYWAATVRQEHDAIRDLFDLMDVIVCSAYVSASDQSPPDTIARRLRQNVIEACRIGASYDKPKPVHAWIMYRRAGGSPYVMDDKLLRLTAGIPLDYGCSLVLNEYCRDWSVTFKRECGIALEVWSGMHR